MNINQRIIELARAEEGTWEWAGDENNPVVVAYYAEAGHPEIKDDSVPWCAAFVGAILAKAGQQGTGSLLARSYEKWGVAVDPADAQPGDIVVYPRGNSTWQGHVGFVDRVEDGNIYTLGGNQNDQVNIKPYPISRAIAVRRAKAQRSSPAKSTTLQASAGGAAAAVGAAGTAVGSLDGNAQIIVVGLLCVVVLGFLWIARERIKKWSAGVK